MNFLLQNFRKFRKFFLNMADHNKSHDNHAFECKDEDLPPQYNSIQVNCFLVENSFFL